MERAVYAALSLCFREICPTLVCFADFGQIF